MCTAYLEAHVWHRGYLWFCGCGVVHWYEGKMRKKLCIMYIMKRYYYCTIAVLRREEESTELNKFSWLAACISRVPFL